MGAKGHYYSSQSCAALRGFEAGPASHKNVPERYMAQVQLAMNLMAADARTEGKRPVTKCHFVVYHPGPAAEQQATLITIDECYGYVEKCRLWHDRYLSEVVAKHGCKYLRLGERVRAWLRPRVKRWLRSRCVA